MFMFDILHLTSQQMRVQSRSLFEYRDHCILHYDIHNVNMITKIGGMKYKLWLEKNVCGNHECFALCHLYFRRWVIQVNEQSLVQILCVSLEQVSIIVLWKCTSRGKYNIRGNKDYKELLNNTQYHALNTMTAISKINKIAG